MQQVGPYEVVRELARGGMGVVYQARRGGREVALKLLLAGADASPGQRQRFRTEMESMARLRHPGIVSVHDAGEHRGSLYFAMDLVSGQSLADMLREGGPLQPRRAGELTLALAEALAAAHAAGILHRDLKPENVLIDDEGRARLTDFGLARDLDARSLTRSGQLLGTPGFCAPEQVAGDRRRVGPATDVYGLGATLYAALTGQAPFGGAGLNEVVVATLERKPERPSGSASDLDPALEAICLRCLEKDPAARYASAEDLADALRAWRDGETGSRRRSPWRVAALAVALVGVTAVAGWGALGSGAQAPPRTVSPSPTQAVVVAEALHPAAAAWPPAAGSTARYRLSVDLEIVSGLPPIYPGSRGYELTQRVERVTDERVEVSAEVAALWVISNHEVTIHYDTREASKGGGLVAELADPILGRRLSWVQDARTGAVLELAGDDGPAAVEFDRDDVVEYTLHRIVRGSFATGNLRGLLQNLWSVFPTPQRAGEATSLDGLLYVTLDHGVDCERELELTADRALVHGRLPRLARKAPVFAPAPTARTMAYDYPPIDVRALEGELRFEAGRGLVEHRLTMDMSCSAGSWTTSFVLERLD